MLVDELEDTIGPHLRQRFSVPEVIRLYRLIMTADPGIDISTLSDLLADAEDFGEYYRILRKYINRANSSARNAEAIARYNFPCRF